MNVSKYQDRSVLEKIISEKSRRRVERSKNNIEYFARTYLQHLLTFRELDLRRLKPTLPEEIITKYSGSDVIFNIVNRKIFETCFRLNNEKLCYAVAMPRGHGKSTSILVYILYALAFQTENFIVYMSSSMQKTQRFFSNIASELQNNKLLLYDFPHLYPAKKQGGTSKANIEFNKTTMILQSGAVLTMSSRGSSPRGLVVNGKRPSLLILDDIDDLDSVYTGNRIETTKDWFRGEILPLGGATGVSILMIGNYMHERCLLADVINGTITGFISERMSCYHEDGTPIWDIWTKERLEKEKANMGSHAFSREYENKAVPKGSLPFNIEHIVKNGFNISDMSEMMSDRIICFIDKNHYDGKSANPDYTGVTVVYKDYDGMYYVLDADIDKHRTETQLEDFIVEFQKRWGFVIIGVEKNNQEGFIERLQNRFINSGTRILVYPIHHTTNKYIRIITSLQPLIETGRMKFRKDYETAYPRLISQLLEIPHGEHDDAPDSLAGAIETICKFYPDASLF